MSFDRKRLSDLILSMNKSAEEPVRIQFLKIRNSSYLWTKLNQPKFRYITRGRARWNGFVPCNRPWQNPEQVDEWLLANIGEQGDGWNRGGAGMILIPNPENAMAFRLRWC
jgi:hypothetical protein